MNVDHNNVDHEYLVSLGQHNHAPPHIQVVAACGLRDGVQAACQWLSATHTCDSTDTPISPDVSSLLNKALHLGPFAFVQVALGDSGGNSGGGEGYVHPQQASQKENVLMWLDAYKTPFQVCVCVLYMVCAVHGVCAICGHITNAYLPPQFLSPYLPLLPPLHHTQTSPHHTRKHTHARVQTPTPIRTKTHTHIHRLAASPHPFTTVTPPPSPSHPPAPPTCCTSNILL